MPVNKKMLEEFRKEYGYKKGTDYYYAYEQKEKKKKHNTKK